MYWVRRNKAFSMLLVFALAFTFAACEGCEGCGEEPVEPPPTIVPDFGVKKEDEPKDPLAEAKEEASQEATSVAITTGDTARAVAGEIEAATNEPKPRPKPRIKDEPETGKLAKAELNKVFHVHEAAMKKCYERALKGEPGLAGKVRLELLIRSGGDVKSANARGTSLKNAAVQSCMERQAETMKFPPPDGGALRVTKTYSFAPEI